MTDDRRARALESLNREPRWTRPLNLLVTFVAGMWFGLAIVMLACGNRADALTASICSIACLITALYLHISS